MGTPLPGGRRESHTQPQQFAPIGQRPAEGIDHEHVVGATPAPHWGEPLPARGVRVRLDGTGARCNRPDRLPEQPRREYCRELWDLPDERRRVEPPQPHQRLRTRLAATKSMSTPRMLRRSFLGASLFLLVACGPDSTAPGCTEARQVRFAPAETTMTLGSSFIASARISCGSEAVGDVVTWQSEDPAIAVVDSGGAVTGTAVGATRILATGQRYGPLGGLHLFVYNPVNLTS